MTPAEDRALAAKPVVDKHGGRVEVGMVIRYYSRAFRETYTAKVTEIVPRFAWTPPGAEPIRQSEGDTLRTTRFDSGSRGTGPTWHACRSSEAEIIIDPEAVAQWELEQLDTRLNLIAAETDRWEMLRRSVEREREQLLRRKEARDV